MAVFAIGDVQGCYDVLVRLLERIHFKPESDQLWLAGDLVNRGPNSADVLRFCMRYPDSVKVVLGNHDLHLLANAAGVSEKKHHLDTLSSVLTAEDSEAMLNWLRYQSLFHHDTDLQFSMVHAGLPAEWSIEDALDRAAEVEAVLRGEQWQVFFQHMYGNKPKRWSEDLTGWDRLRYITNCFTRLRYCHEDGRLALRFKGSPADRPAKQKPWFSMPNRRSEHERIVFGHWSMLGTGQYGNVFSLDSGAVWGEQLTAVRIDQQPYQWFSVEAEHSARDNQPPERVFQRWL